MRFSLRWIPLPRFTFGCMYLCILILLAVLLGSLLGCRGGGGLGDILNALGGGGGDTPPAPDRPVANYGILDWLAVACMVVGIGTIILGTIFPLVPRKTSIVAIGCAIGCWTIKVFMVKWEWAIPFAGLLCGLAFAAPVIVTWVRAQLKRTATALEKSNDPRAATALRVVAEPKRFKTPTQRKAALAKASGKVKVAAVRAKE